MTAERTTAQSLTRILLVVAALVAVPLIANPLVEGFDWSLFDIVLVVVLVGGTVALYEVAVKRPGSWVAAIVSPGVAAVGGAAVVAGEVDDAPGLILIGFVLVGTAMLIGVRSVRGNARGPSAAPPASR